MGPQKFVGLRFGGARKYSFGVYGRVDNCELLMKERWAGDIKSCLSNDVGGAVVVSACVCVPAYAACWHLHQLAAALSCSVHLSLFSCVWQRKLLRTLMLSSAVLVMLQAGTLLRYSITLNTMTTSWTRALGCVSSRPDV